MNASKKDLLKDLEKASEFDQSGLFKKIYEAEYGIFGGEPYGMLIGDYEFSNHPGRHGPARTRRPGCRRRPRPFISAADPELFGLESFTGNRRQARSGQDFRFGRICQVEVVPRIGGFARTSASACRTR